jgi:hypothetical protein
VAEAHRRCGGSACDATLGPGHPSAGLLGQGLGNRGRGYEPVGDGIDSLRLNRR